MKNGVFATALLISVSVYAPVTAACTATKTQNIQSTVQNRPISIGINLEMQGVQEESDDRLYRPAITIDATLQSLISAHAAISKSKVPKGSCSEKYKGFRNSSSIDGSILTLNSHITFEKHSCFTTTKCKKGKKWWHVPKCSKSRGSAKLFQDSVIHKISVRFNFDEANQRLNTTSTDRLTGVNNATKIFDDILSVFNLDELDDLKKMLDLKNINESLAISEKLDQVPIKQVKEMKFKVDPANRLRIVNNNGIRLVGGFVSDRAFRKSLVCREIIPAFESA